MALKRTKAKKEVGANQVAPVVPRRRIVSMRLIISAVTASLIAVSVLGFGTLAERNTRQILTEEIEGRLVLEARNLASLSADALLTEFPELTLCPLVSEIQQDRPDLALVAVLDHENKIQGHIDLKVLGQELELMADMQPRQASRTLLAGEKVMANSDLVMVSVPAKHANGRQVGTAIVGLSQSYVDEMVARPRKAFLILTAGLLLIGVAVTLVIMGFLLRPIGALRSGLERIGRGDLASPIKLGDKTELGLLAETVNGMAREIVKSQEQMLEKERLGAEMSLAHQMQHSLLPEGALAKGDFTCQGTYQAAAEVGGDYYDVIQLEDGKLGVVIADVSGKGLAGCLVTSMLAVLIRSLCERCTSPSELLVKLEKSLLTSLAPGTFVTVFYGILDPESGNLKYASAAHSPLAVYRAAHRDVDWFYTKGIPIGAMRNGVLAKTLEDYETTLAPGDLALQFTDGLSEAWNAEKQEEFDFKRIAEHLIKEGPNGGQVVQDTLLEVVEEWASPDPLGDDFTLLVIERSAESAGKQEDTKESWLADVDTQVGQRYLEDMIASTNEGQGHLQDMMAGTQRLNLPSELDSLTRLRSWLDECLAGKEALSSQQDLIECSLYEVCANIIEHGYKGKPGYQINLWWVPLPEGGKNEDNGTTTTAPAHYGVGYFVICDQGMAFDPTSWVSPDFQDPKIRRRGRGLGWPIIYSSMKKVVYAPETPAGNLTLLRFDPSKHLVT